MRIDVFFDVYPHPAKPYFESQLKEFCRRGHDLRLFSFGTVGRASSGFPITPIRTLRQRPRLALSVLWRAVTLPRRSWRILRSEKGLLQAIKALAIDAQLPKHPPDVNFVHNLATAVSLSHLKRACEATKLAIYYHGGEIPGVRQIPFEWARRALEQADVVFSNTQFSVNEAIARGARRDSTACVPVGFCLEQFRQPNDRAYLAGNIWRFVCVGRMSQEKGFDIALKAFATVRRNTLAFHVTLIGDGPEMENLKMLTDSLQMKDAVTFLGHLESQKLIPLISKFDALVLSSMQVRGSSWTETQATVMQEAMLMGTLVVASDVGGVRESLPTALHPYMYSPGSANELAERLISIMKCGTSELRSLGHLARHFVEENYDVRAINEKILARIADSSSPPAERSRRSSG